MEKHKENLFLDKFSLLNSQYSQEHSEEIHWSSSGSSGYEDRSLNGRFSNHVCKSRVLKRKRKKKVPINACNLSVTILDKPGHKKNVNYEEKSPILRASRRSRSSSVSPILKLSQVPFKVNNKDSSPILQSKRIHVKSPILVSKNVSPKSTFKVRKKLFNMEKHSENSVNRETQNKSVNEKVLSVSMIKKSTEHEESDIIVHSVALEDISENAIDSDTSKAKIKVAERVKLFFDSHFSSQNSLSSQNSISDFSSPKSSSKTSEEIEVFTCKTQILSNTSQQINNSTESKKERSSHSSENSVYDFSKNTKKIKYKKNGHANRLNKLLKKQNASLSLWQHERFLAANSNFVIPKGECSVFQIQKVDFQYGCHVLGCYDKDGGKFLILINNCYVLENIVHGMVLKLYMPFVVEEYSCDCQLIMNVTRFECFNTKC